jgi:hypothetical protein
MREPYFQFEKTLLAVSLLSGLELRRIKVTKHHNNQQTVHNLYAKAALHKIM